MALSQMSSWPGAEGLTESAWFLVWFGRVTSIAFPHGSIGFAKEIGIAFPHGSIGVAKEIGIAFPHGSIWFGKGSGTAVEGLIGVGSRFSDS